MSLTDVFDKSANFYDIFFSTNGKDRKEWKSGWKLLLFLFFLNG